MGTDQGQRRNAAGPQRVALIVFGALFVLLFVLFAAAQGIGNPSVPSGDVALVEEVPDGAGEISRADFDRMMLQLAAQGGLKKAPKPGQGKFDELRDKAMEELLNAAWLQGEAAELDIEATPKQIADELEQIKEQNFPNKGDFEKFLKESRFTQEDVDLRVKLQVLSTQIEQQISGAAGATPSNDEITEFYEAAKATQFTTKPSRDIRIITNKDKAEVEAAKKALEADDSVKNWKKVAQKYSSDPTTKSKGGLQEGLSEELLATAGPLKEAVFGNDLKAIVGPLKYQGNFTVIQVVKVNPEEVQPLGEVRATISSQLSEQRRQQEFSEFVANYQSKWTSRTFCAEGFTVERCSNFKSDGRQVGANPACYEANPKTPPSECPAPVEQLKPAVPGSVSVMSPQGTRLPQRPRPAGLEETPGAGALEGLQIPGAAGAPPGG